MVKIGEKSGPTDWDPFDPNRRSVPVRPVQPSGELHLPDQYTGANREDKQRELGLVIKHLERVEIQLQTATDETRQGLTTTMQNLQERLKALHESLGDE